MNYNAIAAYYGRNATFDAIEAQFRPYRREAQQLFSEIQNGERPATAPRSANRAANTSHRNKPATRSTNVPGRSTATQKGQKRTSGGNSSASKVASGRVGKGKSAAKKADGYSTKKMQETEEESEGEVENKYEGDCDEGEGQGNDEMDPGPGSGAIGVA